MDNDISKTYPFSPLGGYLFRLLHEDAEEGIYGFLSPPYQFTRVTIDFGGEFSFEFLREGDEFFHYRLVDSEGEEVLRADAPQKVRELLGMIDDFGDIPNSFSPLRKNIPTFRRDFIYDLITNLIVILMYRSFPVNVTLHS